MRITLKLIGLVLLSTFLVINFSLSGFAEEEEVIRVTGVELDKSEATLVLGEQLELTARVYPANADDKRVEWTISDPIVAEVETSGQSAMVISRSQGEAVITVTTLDLDHTADFYLKVIVLVRSIDVQPKQLTLAPGETAELEARIIPRDATEQGVLWESTNPGVASVKQDGRVEALAEGEARIIARSVEDSQVNAYSLLTVASGVSIPGETEVPGQESLPGETEELYPPEAERNFAFYSLYAAAILIGLSVLLYLFIRRRNKLPEQAGAAASFSPGAGKGKTPLLVGISGIYAGRKIEFDQDIITIGRDPSAARVVYPSDNTGISRLHCTIYFDSELESFTLVDSSSNGTFLSGGRKIEKNQPYTIQPGEQFSLSEEGEVFTVELE